MVAHPTDTCYGLAVDIFNLEAVERLYQRKGMERDKPVSILVRSLEEAKRYGVFSEHALHLAQRFWPGAFTIVVPRTLELPSWINPGEDTVGIRCIDEPITVQLLQAFGGPVTTTSANFHGKPSPYRVEDISLEPDFILDKGVLSPNKPSTIVKVIGDSLTVIRRGDLVVDFEIR